MVCSIWLCIRSWYWLHTHFSWTCCKLWEIHYLITSDLWVTKIMHDNHNFSHICPVYGKMLCMRFCLRVNLKYVVTVNCMAWVKMLWVAVHTLKRRRPVTSLFYSSGCGCNLRSVRLEQTSSLHFSLGTEAHGNVVGKLHQWTRLLPFTSVTHVPNFKDCYSFADSGGM